jgi:hypothetical protein
MYLLIYDESVKLDVEADLQAEVEVEFGRRLPIGMVSELMREDDGVRRDDVDPIRVLRIDNWSPKLIGLLDTHVIRLERTGAQFLFLTTSKLAEQLLAAAPNFRNRVTEVLRILPDDPSGAIRN